MTIDDRRTGAVDPPRGPPGGPTTDPCLEVVDLHKSYGEVAAVRGVSFSLESGSVLGLLGPNGAGKSSTVGCIAGLLEPDAGSIRVNVTTRAKRSRAWLGIATQDLALYPDLSVAQNLRFFGGLGARRASSLESSMGAVIDRLELEPMLGRRVRDLSGGQQRLVHVAAAAVHGPKVLVLDEPTAGLDVRARGLVLRFVRTVADEGTAVVYSSHYLQEVEDICDDVVIIDRGRCIASGTVVELIERHGAGRVELDVAGSTHVHEGVDVAAAVASFAPFGAIDDVRVLRPSLEAVFVQLTGTPIRPEGGG